MQHQIMKYTDLELSPVCLGGGPFGERLNKEQVFELLDAFVRKGGNFIDTANVYCRWVKGLDNCSEKVIGEWLKERGAYNDVVVATKGAHYSFDTGYTVSRVNETEVRKDLEESLLTLGLDTIPFYWLHRDDESQPIEAIVDMLETFRQEGKIRYYGFSNYKAARMEAAEKYLASKGLHSLCGISNQWSMASINSGKNTNQDPSLVEFSKEEYEWHKKTGIASVPFSSTASGFFEKLKRAGVAAKDGKIVEKGNLNQLSAGMRNAFVSEGNLRKYENLLKLQQETGHSLQALSIACLIHQPFQVFPVCGVSNLIQLEEVMETGEITKDELPEELLNTIII